MVRKRRIKDFSHFQKLELFIVFQTYVSIIIFYAKKILSRGEAIFQGSHDNDFTSRSGHS